MSVFTKLIKNETNNNTYGHAKINGDFPESCETNNFYTLH